MDIREAEVIGNGTTGPGAGATTHGRAAGRRKR